MRLTFSPKSESSTVSRAMATIPTPVCPSSGTSSSSHALLSAAFICAARPPSPSTPRLPGLPLKPFLGLPAASFVSSSQSFSGTSFLMLSSAMSAVVSSGTSRFARFSPTKSQKRRTLARTRS